MALRDEVAPVTSEWTAAQDGFPTAGLSGGRFAVFAAVEIAVVVAVINLLPEAAADGPTLALIPTLVALTAKKFFGKKKGTTEGVIGDHPVVAFIFGALTTGEMENAEEMVAEDCAAYANGYTVVDPSTADAVDQFKANVHYWRSAVPDLAIDLYDEVVQKLPDKTDSVVVRYVVSGTLQADGLDHAFESEAAAFIKVTDRKLSEWRVVIDTAFLDEVRTAMGLTTSD